MKYLLLFIISFILLNTNIGQTLEMQTISNSGISTDKLESTFGETVIAGNNNLTQGFHQGNLIVTKVENIIKDIEVLVYPNPTMQGVNINTTEFSNIQVRLFDIQGKYLKTESIDKFSKYIDLSIYQTGTYFIQLYHKNQILKTFKIEKIK